MINRVLIRIKVVQMVYSYLLTKDGMKMSEALKTLSQSMDKSYELYHYLLILPIALPTDPDHLCQPHPVLGTDDR